MYTLDARGIFLDTISRKVNAFVVKAALHEKPCTKLPSIYSLQGKKTRFIDIK